MAAVVGTAYVRLRLLTDTIGKDIEKSVKSGDFQDVNIKVNADTLKADANSKPPNSRPTSLTAKNRRSPRRSTRRTRRNKPTS